MGQLMALHICIYLYILYIYNSDHDDHLGYPRLTTVNPLKNSCLDPRLSFSYQGVTVELPGARWVRFWLFELVEPTGFGVKSQHFSVSKSGAQQSFFYCEPFHFFLMCGIFKQFMLNRWIQPPILPYFSLRFSRQTSNLQHWQMLPQGGAP